ncbi:CrcB family protein [Weissella confusa]|uniref:Fluoride-specific ion channel n=1 Tax=Weissella confusa TaxID=1583 RepID=A0A923SNX1_WEICO|nr:CrcB family protein [Weissella confusa]
MLIQVGLAGLGAVIGSMGRFSLLEIAPKVFGTARLLIQVPDFPLSTLVINLTGTFLSAFLVVVWSKKITLAQPVADFIMVGVLGAYTTYSTAILDMVKHGPMAISSYKLGMNCHC